MTAAGRVIFCATQRLARRLQQTSVPDAEGVRRALVAQTMGQWLDTTLEAAWLGGALGEGGPDDGTLAMPALVLSDLQERLLWKDVIGKALRGKDDAPLFSVDGLAAAAQEAHALIETWRLSLSAGATPEERQFALWRRAFLRRCKAQRWHDASRHRVWQIDCIAAGIGNLPTRIEHAGFDRFNPQETRLLAALEARGVALAEYCEAGADAAASAVRVRHLPYPDAATQFRAMAQWTADHLAAFPTARIGLVVPELDTHRNALTRALDQALDPAALAPAAAQVQRLYNVSLGVPLARLPLVDVALSCLRLGLSAHRIEQTELGRLLRSLYWSADVAEADARACFELRCRKRLRASLSLQAVVQALAGVDAPRLIRHLDRLLAWSTRVGGRRSHAAWGAEFLALLEAIGWPGERVLSSHDYQARESFLALLSGSSGLASLDQVLGECTASEALSTLADLCRRTLFQAQTEGNPQVEVLGLLEAAGARFDALWVAGMTDAVWPPPARPNPLLPSALQRARGCPNSSPEVQRAFAGGVHQRFLQVVTAGNPCGMTAGSPCGMDAGIPDGVAAAQTAGQRAPEIVFSWPQSEGEQVLRPSPLLDLLRACDGSGAPAPQPATPLAERLRAACPDALESLIDHQAPPVADAGHLKGGTWLMRAQAICPAWAFYQYRLGAEDMEAPADGLDARDRGSLLHSVLEAFWAGRGSASVATLSPEARQRAVHEAVLSGMAAYDAEHAAAPLPPRFRALEAQRLEALLAAWVEVELARPEAFEVIACEAKHTVLMEGIEAQVTVDRIDQLSDGRRVVLDYKTGAQVDASSWASARISEPQLPIYATWTIAPAPLAAIAFAQVRSDKMRFVGIAESPDLLPKVASLDGARKIYDAERFPDWAALLAHWQRALSATAAEIKAGDARVVFESEQALNHCPVRPLLRLAERRLLRQISGSRT